MIQKCFFSFVLNLCKGYATIPTENHNNYAISHKNEFQKETFLFRSTSIPAEFSPIDEFFVAAFTKRMYLTLPKLKYYSKRL